MIVLEKLEEHWWCEVDEDGIDIPLTDANQLNILGESPIHITAWKGDPEDIRWLLDNGADINQRGDFGMTPLHYAFMGGKKENIEVLLETGADQTIRCEYGLLAHEGRPDVKKQ